MLCRVCQLEETVSFFFSLIFLLLSIGSFSMTSASFTICCIIKKKEAEKSLRRMFSMRVNLYTSWIWHCYPFVILSHLEKDWTNCWNFQTRKFIHRKKGQIIRHAWWWDVGPVWTSGEFPSWVSSVIFFFSCSVLKNSPNLSLFFYCDGQQKNCRPFDPKEEQVVWLLYSLHNSL